MARRDPLAAARARLLQLKAAHDAGTIDARRYDEERRKVEQEIGAALIADEPKTVRPSRRLVAVLSLAVVALAVVGYSQTGAPSLVWPGAAAVEAAASAANGQIGPQQIQAMVDQLAARLEKNPNDAQGWVMLARSYTVLGRFEQALPAYAKAVELVPGNAQILSDYADTVAATKGTANNPQSIALIDRALAIDPKHPKALALAGTVAFERADYVKAIADWQKIVDQLPPGNEFAERIQSSIGEARERATAAGRCAASSRVGQRRRRTCAGRNDDRHRQERSERRARQWRRHARSGARGTGRARRRRLRVRASDRRADAARGAAERPVRDLPLTFTLDDSMAMSPAAKLSSATQVTIGARVSKSGTALPQPGDLAGETTGVAPGATGVAVRIGSVVGKP
jgi:cytochrome c-type biogenesis protein CcmH